MASSRRASQLVIEVGVVELHFGDAVFVVEGDGGAFFDGLLEVVDGDVVAEDLFGAFLPGDEGGAGEGDEGGVGEGAAHVGGEVGVLGAVGFVGHDDDVGAFGEDGIEMAGFGAEFLDEGEDVAGAAHEELFQMVA